jgi:hypothetical protein
MMSIIITFTTSRRNPTRNQNGMTADKPRGGRGGGGGWGEGREGHFERPRRHRNNCAPKQLRAAAKFEDETGSEEVEESRVKTELVNLRAYGLQDGGKACVATISRERCENVAPHCREGGEAVCH